MRHILQSLFGLDLSTAQKVIVASVVILILLILLGLFVRQIQGGRLKLKGQGGGRARQPRLGVVDAHNLDRQRQLILIRRDNVEHLIMIGGASDVVVETNIVRSGARAAPQPLDFAASERPLAFESLVPPEPVRQEPVRQEPARQEPARQEPVRQEPVRQESVSIAQPRPETLPPLPQRQIQTAPPSRPVHTQTQADAALAAVAAVAVPAALATAANAMSSSGSTASQPTPTVAPPSFSRDHAPSPTASAVELDSMARQLEEALKRPFSAVRPANTPGEAPVTAKPAPMPDAAPVEAEAAEVAPTPVEHLPMPTPPAPPETSGRPVSLPADVEAELELALGLKPTRSAAPAHDVASKASAAPQSNAVGETGEDEPPLMAADDLTVAPGEPHAAAVTSISEPETKTAQVEPAPTMGEPELPPKEAEPEQKPAVIDPFSVDAIEAEFARLLGRDPKAKS